jgi:hypothetical protein
MCVKTVPITGNKKQEILGYPMKNKATDLSRIGLNLKCAQARKFEIWKGEA